jgi:hypothetical protein
MPYLAKCQAAMADLARIDRRDRTKWRTVGGCCGQDCGQRSVEVSLPAGVHDRLFANASMLWHNMSDQICLCTCCLPVRRVIGRGSS